MWFDRLDPRDPLQLTDGVYGLLTRYYFINNMNAWFWILYGNDELKGLEIFPSDSKMPEYGGRLQSPLFSGEIAATFHHRNVRGSSEVFPITITEAIPEDRFAMDGKWDVGVGLWFEAALTHQDLAISGFRYRRFLNAGIDYTFNVGNGLHVMSEYLRISSAEKAFATGESFSFSAFSLNYPFGLLDKLNAILYYDWDNRKWFSYANWQRTYDHWSFYLIAFCNPSTGQLYQNLREDSSFSGTGLQAMILYNH
jgi:hypothetical protein